MKHFIRQFVKKPKETGSIIESCSDLSHAITSMPNLKNASVVVEIGPGTGVFTEKIIEQISKDSIFFALEINPIFAKKTKERCPDAIIYNDSFFNIEKYLAEHMAKKCDCIISGIPWTSFEKEKQEKAIDLFYNILRPGGEFLTFTYLPSSLLPSARHFKGLLYDKFKMVNKSRVFWNNFPPAFVYHAIR